jgi:hypothetical protein
MATNDNAAAVSTIAARAWRSRYPLTTSVELGECHAGDGVAYLAIAVREDRISAVLDPAQLRELGADLAARADILEGRT